MRQKFRKAVAALSRGQLFRIDQTIAFDFVEPDYDPNVIGACCTDSDGDGTFCDCESNVTARDCCLQKGIHSPGLTCDGEAGGVVVCCDPDPPFVGCCIPGQAQCITVREDVCAQLGGVSYSSGCSGVECGCNGAWCCDDGNSIRTCTEAIIFTKTPFAKRIIVTCLLQITREFLSYVLLHHIAHQLRRIWSSKVRG